MDEYTYIEILIEDKSGGILAEQIMDKYVMDRENITYKIHSFKGMLHHIMKSDCLNVNVQEILVYYWILEKMLRQVLIIS